MQGAVEIAPKTNLADGICDLVSTGNTLSSNGLKEVECILNSEAILIKNKNISEKLDKISSRLVIRMKAVLKAQNTRYIVLHAPVEALDDIKDVLLDQNHLQLFLLKVITIRLLCMQLVRKKFFGIQWKI